MGDGGRKTFSLALARSFHDKIGLPTAVIELSIGLSGIMPAPQQFVAGQQSGGEQVRCQTSLQRIALFLLIDLPAFNGILTDCAFSKPKS